MFFKKAVNYHFMIVIEFAEKSGWVIKMSYIFSCKIGYLKSKTRFALEYCLNF